MLVKVQGSPAGGHLSEVLGRADAGTEVETRNKMVATDDEGQTFASLEKCLQWEQHMHAQC
jgi:hypothetical protein